MNDTKDFIVAHVTATNAFVPYAFSASHSAAVRRRKQLIEQNSNRDLRVIKRIASGEYADVTPEDEPNATEPNY